MHRRSLLVHLPAELGEESEFSLIWCCSAGGRPRSTLALIWRSLRRQRPERCNRLLKLTRFIAECWWECLCVRGCRCVSVWNKRRKKDERGEKGEWAASVNTAGYPLWTSWFFFRGKYSHTQTHELYCGWMTHTRSPSHSWSFFVVLGVSRKNVRASATRCCRARMETKMLPAWGDTRGDAAAAAWNSKSKLSPSLLACWIISGWNQCSEVFNHKLWPMIP